MENLEINKETDERLYEKEVARLDVKHTSMSKNLRMKPFARFLNWFGYFCQANSFLLAASGASAVLWCNMGANGVPFMMLALLFFAMVEGAVYLANSTFHKMRLDDSYISPVIYVLLFLSFAISTPVTYYCTPSAVELFTASPVLIDTAKVNIEHDILTKTDTSYWHSKKVKARNEYLAYFESNKKQDAVTGNWRLSSTLTKIHAGMKSQVDTMQRHLDHSLLAANNKRLESLSSALQLNERAFLDYKEWCASFGGILALISVLSMVLLFPARWYFEGWEREYKAELETILARKDRTDPTQPKQKHTRVPKPNKTKQSENTGFQVATAQHKSMQFPNQSEQNQTEELPYHGKIFKPENGTVNHIYYETEKGKFTTYTQKEISRKVASLKKKREEKGRTDRTEYEQRLTDLNDLMKVN